MEDTLPNYYRKAELDSEWWESDNLLTPNFWADKVFKNIGYGLGSLAGGGVWTKGIKMLAKASSLITAGKAAQTVATIESAMSTVPKIQRLSALQNTLNNLSKGVTTAVRNNGERFTTSILGTFGEASMESLHSSNDFRQRMIDKYINENGVRPEGDDLKEINNYAEKVGNYVFGMNTMLITGSNYIQLPKILGSSKKAEKAFINDINQSKIGQAFEEIKPKTKFGRVSNSAYKGVKGMLPESFEEGGQFAISTGVDSYFERAYGNKEDINSFFKTLHGAMGNVFGEGVDEVLNSKEGIESLLIGGLAGGIQQAPGNFMRGIAKNKNTKIALDEINNTNIDAVLKDQANFLNIGIGSQSLRQEAVINNDTLSEKDFERDFTLSYVMPRVKYGKSESIYNELKSYREQASTLEGFTELQNSGIAFEKENQAQFIQRIVGLENTAKAVETHYDNIVTTYSSILAEDSEGNVIKDAKGNPLRKYNSIVIDKLVYAASKIDDYAQRIPELSLYLSQANINSAQILNELFQPETTEKNSIKESIDQINAMDVTNDDKDQLKRSMEDLVELALRRKLFIDQYNDIKDKPLNYSVLPDPYDVSPKGKVDVSQKDRNKKSIMSIQVGKEYSLQEPIRLENGKLIIAPKLTILSKTLGGELEVRLPDGREIFMTPLEFNTYKLTEENNTSQEFEDALNQSIDEVLNLPANSNIAKPEEGQNKLAYINSLGDQKLTKQIVSKFNKLTKEIIEIKQKEKEIADALKASEELKKQQDDLSDDDATQVTIIPDGAGQERIDSGETGALKAAVDFFDSTSTESEEYNDPAKSANHIRRSRIFLNNLRKFKNRNKIRAIVFTYNQETDLGLSGITGLSYNMTKEQIDADPNFKTRVTDVDNGFVAMVFVEVDGDKRYFVDENGNRVGEVGKQADLGKVIFQTMATTAISDSRGADRYRTERSNEKAAFVRFSQIWKRRREKLINGTETPMLEFRVSKGFAVTQKQNGVFKKSAVTNELIDNKTLASVPGIINVATGEATVHNGDSVTTKKGYVYFQDGEIIQYLNNNKLGKAKATTLYHAVKSIITKLRKDASEGKTPKFEDNKILFIKNILNYQKFDKDKDPKNNQIWFNVEESSVRIGNKSYSFSEIDKLESEIVNQLSDVYHSANSKTIKKKSSEKFYEYYFENGKLEEREWVNYQSYLASGKDSTGKNVRPVDEIPFVTINSPTEAQPYPFAGKYATLSNFEMDGENYIITEEDKKTEKKLPTESGGNAPTKPSEVIEQPSAVKVGKFSLNDGGINTIKRAFEFIFKANILPNGEVTIDTSGIDEASEKANEETFKKFAENEAYLNAAKEKYAPSIPEGASDTVIASIFYFGEAKGQIEKAIQDEKAAKEVVKEEVKPETPTTQTEIDDTKADIERRRQEELNEYKDKDASKVEEFTFTDEDGKVTYVQIRTYPDGKRMAYQGIEKNKYGNVNDSSPFEISKEQSTEDYLKVAYPESTFGTSAKTGERTGEEASLNAYSRKINAKYDAEIKAIEESTTSQPTSTTEEIQEAKPQEEIVSFKGRKKKYNNDDTRKVSGVEGVGNRMTDAEIEIFKKWHSENTPNIPFEVLDKIITLHDGSKAWGVFEQGVAKFFKRGLKGTEYHEVFEGIWKAFLTEGERQALIAEFRSKKGNFLDRESGKYIVYSEATDRQIKERIADDFADFRLGKISATTLSQKIKNFFKSILDFFKSFVQNPSMKDSLFKAIDAGKFKDYTVPQYVKSAAPEYRLKYTPDGRRFTEDQVHGFVQDMTLTTAQYLFDRNNEGGIGKLFSPEGTSGKEVYNHLRDMYSEYIEDIGDDLFDYIFLRTRDLMKTIGVNIDTDGIIGMNDSTNTNKSYSKEAFSVDFKKNAKFSVKFLLATNPKAEKSYKLGESAPKLIKSAIKGFEEFNVMGNYNKSFATLLSKLSNTSLQKFDKNLIDLAISDGNYYRIVTRLKGDPKSGKFDYAQFSKDDWKFYIQFVQSFVKSNPEVEVATVGGAGIENESYTSPSDRMSIVTTIRNEWFQNVQKLSKSENSYITKAKDKNNKVIFVINDKHEYYPSRKGLTESTAVLSSYLKNIGIDISSDVIDQINKNETSESEFLNAVLKIYEGGPKEYANLSGNKFVGINSHILKIADIYVRTVNPDQSTTRINIENQRTSNYSDSNAPSVFEAQFNEANSIEELLEIRPELNDKFSQKSLILKKGGPFFDEDGKKRKNAILKIGVVEGVKDELNDNGVAISSLTKGDRLTLGINQNIKGNYYILIPADSETERTLKLGTFVDYELFNDEGDRAFKKIFEIFKGYLEDEIDLALDWKNRSKLSATKDNAKQLRFFRDILSSELVEEIENAIEKGQSRSKILKIVKDNNQLFEEAIKETLNNLSNKALNDLIQTGEVNIVPLSENESGYTYENLNSDFANNNKINRLSMSNEKMMQVLSFVNMNYMIANMEMHKFIFGDPYQFKIKNGKLDETKRIKSWLSPRRITIDTPQLNEHLNKNYNNASEEIELDVNDPFHYTFKPFVKTVTLKDVTPVSAFQKQFKGYDEGDGFSIILDSAYREVKLKNGDDFNQNWFQWNQSYARQKMSAKKLYDYKGNDALRKHDEATIKKPQPKFVTEVLKPIVSGSKFGVNRIEGILDKFSQMPITYKMVEGTNLENLYVQMLNQKVGYVVFNSGRKEGARESHSLYSKDLNFNTENFAPDTIENVAWSTYGIQVENTYEEGGTQTRGSQLNKNDTMDMYGDGKEAEGFEGVDALANEKIKIFKEMHENAFGDFLEKLGLENLNGNYVIADRVKISKELELELLRRQISQNAIDTIRLDQNGQFRMPFEASSEYEQIRSVLISMVNKSLISPAMNGKAHVQVPATMWENATKGRKLLRKIGDNYVDITRDQYEALSDTDKASVVLSSDTLKFSKDVDGERHMEIMIPNFWKKYFTDKKRFPNDKAIFEYLNRPENQKILFGVGFRIPHQATSSSAVFKIAGFLDASMGATVVVPSEIVAVAGSDFDIDKLNMYLKSVFVDENGDVKLIEYKGSKEATIDFYEKMFDQTVQKELIDVWTDDRFEDDLVDFFDQYELIENVEELDPFDLKNALGEEMFAFYAKRERTIRAMIDKATEEKIKTSEYIGYQIGKLADKAARLNIKKLNADLRRDYAKRMYKKSLENRYYEVLQNIISLPGNFERLMSPVGDAGLSKDADTIDKFTNDSEANVKNKLLSMSYMTSLRHAFLIAKRWVGIAAVNITGHSIGQKVGLYFDSRLMNQLSDYDKSFLGDLSLNVPHNTVTVDGQEMISLGGRTTAYSKKDNEAIEFISDRLSGYATAFVDVAKDPYILKLLRGNLVVGTAMLMERIGVGALTPYFLNQPMIVEYLKLLDKNKSKGLFGKNNLELIYTMFPVGTSEKSDISELFEKDESGKVNFDKSKDNLLDIIGQYSNSNGTIKTTDFDYNATQRAVFKEFLKLSKLGQLNFKFSQAYNYDTTRVQNYEGFKRKMMRTGTAQKSNIISSIDKVMNQTFIGDQMKLIRKELMALGAIMKLDSKEIEIYMDEVMEPFYADEYMSEDDFNFVSKKLKNSFLDFVIQLKSENVGLSNYKNLLVGKNSVANRLLELKKQEKYKDSELLNNLTPFASLEIDGPVTVMLKVKPTDSIDINRHIGLMLELKENEPEFYNDLVLLSILQGSSTSPRSISSIIPIDDRANIISPVINALKPSLELNAFNENGLFFRNNFRDDRIVPVTKIKISLTEDAFNPRVNFGNDVYVFLTTQGIIPANPRVIKLNNKYSYSNNADRDVVKIKRYQVLGSVVLDFATAKEMSYGNYKKLVDAGEISPSELIGYMKVKSKDGTPLTTQETRGDKVNEYSIFKMINLYGSSGIVAEYPKIMGPSQFNNNTYVVKEELTNEAIISMFGEESVESTIIPQAPQAPTQQPTVNQPSTDKKFKSTTIGNYTILEIIDDKGVSTFDVSEKEEGIVAEYLKSYDEALEAIEVDKASTSPNTKIVDYKYYGRFYQIVLDENNNPIDVVGYKGKKDAKQKLLDLYAKNPNIDPQSEKSFIEEVEEVGVESKPISSSSTNSFKFSDGTVINTGNITLNEQQGKALQLAVNAINKGQTKFVIRGYAGTGKSTISKFIREYLQNSKSFKDVSYSSPTHKANTNLLIQLIRGKVFNKNPSTIAKLLNKIKGEDNQYITGPNNKMPYSGVLIVDESSMIDTEDYNFLMKLAERKGTTIVFMGDPAQLPPVLSNQLSKALQFSNEQDGVELTQVMRQKENNPLLDILTNIRENLTSIVEKFSFETNINSKKEGVEFTNDYLSFNEKILEYFKSPEYREDPTHAKILTYTNASSSNYNTLIQSQLGYSPYGVGSIMMGYEQVGESSNVHNGQDYKILESEYITDRDVNVFRGNVGNKSFNIQEKISGYKVKMRRVFSKEDEQLLNDSGQTALLKPIEIFIINPNDDRNIKFMEQVLAFKKVLNDKTIAWRFRKEALDKFERFFNTYQLPADIINYKGNVTTLPKLRLDNPELFKVNRQTGKSPFDETSISDKPQLVKNIDYGYAVTSHKAQGSTYKYTFVDYENMENPGNNKIVSDGNTPYANERQQLKYVALSRASILTFIFSRKAGDNNSNSFETQEDFVPWTTETETVGESSPMIREFYNSLTVEQKAKLGSIESIIEEYNNIPMNINQESFIEMLRCNL
jgi:hypothetical protein